MQTSPWHVLSGEEALQQANSGLEGLAGAEQARWDLDLPYGSPAPAGAEAAPKGKQFLH